MMRIGFEQEVKKIFGTDDLNALAAIAHKAAQYDAMQKHNARGAGRKNLFTENDVANMVMQRKQGRTMQEIAAQYGTSRQTVSQYMHDLQELPDMPDYTWRLNYMNGQQLCTAIFVDFRHEKVQIRNYTDKIILRAFGVKEHPTWQDFELFLQERCLPQSRANLKLILRDMGLPFYDPFTIIEKTDGRMAGDNQWVQMIPLNRTRKAAAHGKH